jgi:hypothetical protein
MVGITVRGVVPGVECGEGGHVHPATTTSAMHSIARAGKVGFMHFDGIVRFIVFWNIPFSVFPWGISDSISSP